MNGRTLIFCLYCGAEPVPIGSDTWRRWWLGHWTVCKGATLDAVSLANLAQS